jgi:acetyltransferase-like isoleucine patch superfamily enzyme
LRFLNWANDLMRPVFRFFTRAIVRPLAFRMLEVTGHLLSERDRAGRQERLARLQSCGTNTRFEGHFYISEPRTVCLGNNVQVGPGAVWVTGGGLTVGDNTRFGRNVTIHTTRPDPSGTALPTDHRPHLVPVAVGRNVVIGDNVSIAPGVTIGDGAIIGLSSVITRDVPPLAVVEYGSPGPVGCRDTVHYEALDRARQYADAHGNLLSAEVVRQFGRHGDEMGDQMFFIVTTGRSGSQSIADALAQHPQITCLHESCAQLIRLATEYMHGVKTEAEARAELAAIYCTSRVFPGGVYGESDQKLAFLIPLLADLMPGSKFIWLIRDGRDVVASTYVREWYSPDRVAQGFPTGLGTRRVWDYYQLSGALCGAFSASAWEKMSVFERNCWGWTYINERIEGQMAALPPERWTMVRLHELSSRTADLFTFLGVDPVPVDVKRLNTVRPEHQQRLTPWQQWTPDQHAAFDRWCGAAMDRWYTGWREG